MRVRNVVAARLAIAWGTALVALALGLAGAGWGGIAAAAPAAPVTPAAPAPAAPLIGPAPKGFVATSVTFTSPDEAYVLGTAPCTRKPCGSIVRTLNRGATWVGIPAPVVAIGGFQSTGPAAWGIRFATASHGFVFGDGLWETTNGGGRWTKESFPGAAIVSLEIQHARCSPSRPPARPAGARRSRPACTGARSAAAAGTWSRA